VSSRTALLSEALHASVGEEDCRPSPSAHGWPASSWPPSAASRSGAASGRGGQP